MFKYPIVTVLGLVVCHLITTFSLMHYAGEVEIMANYLYWYVVTISSVGYGDLSPTTDFGEYTVAFWVIPGGFIIFATIIGAITTYFTRIHDMKKNGLSQYGSFRDHVVLVCDDEFMVRELVKETKQKLGSVAKVVATTGDSTWEHWVKLDSWADRSGYFRANFLTCKRIVINLDSDQDTLTAALTLSAITDKPIIASFQNPEIALLLEHTNQVEVVCANENKMLARSMADPGISKVFDALYDTSSGETLYCHEFNRAGDLHSPLGFGNQFHVKVIAWEGKDGKLSFNLSADAHDVYKVYYISERRIS